MQDPVYLAQTAARVQQEQPGLLSRLFGGRRAAPSDGASVGGMPSGAGTGGMLGSPMAKGVLGGIAAAGLMNMLTGPHYYSGGLFGAPGMGGFFGGDPCSAVTASERDTRKDTKKVSKRVSRALRRGRLRRKRFRRRGLLSSLKAHR